MGFNREAEGNKFLRRLEEAYGPIPEPMNQFVAWAISLCTPKNGPQGDLQRDALYVDLLAVLRTQEQWMSNLLKMRYNEVEAQLLTLFPNRASLACGVRFSLRHLQEAVVTLVVVHRRLELFGEIEAAVEAA